MQMQWKVVIETLFLFAIWKIHKVLKVSQFEWENLIHHSYEFDQHF